MNDALLSFSIGPVQDFIAAARTTRDLWTGSYLLSWLTAHVARAVQRDLDASVIFPVLQNNPLFRVIQGENMGQAGLIASLPNTILAEVRADSADRASNICTEIVREEWRKIREAVRMKLRGVWDSVCRGWDERWEEQVRQRGLDSSLFWDVRVQVLPAGQDVTAMQRLLRWAENDDFKLRRELVGKLLAADKNIRRYPPHESKEGIPDTRPKCSLLGSHAQMGPIAVGQEPQNTVTKNFWEQARRHAVFSRSRLGPRDRFCAISLIKRFAWTAYFAEQRGLKGLDHRFCDLDTVCAAEWLNRAGIDPDKTRSESGPYWSGHWLRWKGRLDGQAADTDDPEECPDEATWKLIREAKNSLEPVPTYYAALMLDGDGMGKLLRACGREQLAAVSRALAHFALSDAPPLVEKALGTLVYAGGDDLLGLLPAATSIEAAQEIKKSFERALAAPECRPDGGEGARCSAGLVLAHYKANLRDVLQAARAAERQAKDAGGNRLTLAILRRSGEHSSVVCRWDHLTTFSELVRGFKTASDRWAYRFRQELEQLPDVLAVRDAELRRLLKRAEGFPEGFFERVIQLWNGVAGTATPEAAEEFVQLVQSASFLARGGKE